MTREPVEVAKDPRRHDLDALRGFAMVLGIVLHGALAYMPAPGWPVQDGDQVVWMQRVVQAIHGFRMPVFFLISGFFTAMLWERRGLGGLVRQRTMRIALPLAIGCVTIIPMMWGVVAWTSWRATSMDPVAEVTVAEDATIWSAALEGDVETLRVLVAGGADVNEADEQYRTTPLGWSVLGGHAESAAVLLELGADVNRAYGNGSTAMHTAAFLGRDGVAEELLNAGADLTILDGWEQTPIDALAVPEPMTMMIAGAMQLELTSEQMLAGRERIRELLAASGIEAEPAESESMLRVVVTWLMTFPFFHHLWFLWYLCLFVVGFAAVVSLFGWVRVNVIPAVLIGSPLCLLWLVPLTLPLQWRMGLIGADTSLGIIPIPKVFAFYAIFYGFGALVYGRCGVAQRLGRGWWWMLPIAAACFPVGLWMTAGMEGLEWTGELWVVRLAQTLFCWLSVFGLIGVFECVLSRGRGWVRYLSDSSYWLYLVHMPLVVAGQELLRTQEMAGWAKLSVLVVGCTLMLLVSYQVMVRHTPIGWLLNGRRGKSRAPTACVEG